MNIETVEIFGNCRLEVEKYESGGTYVTLEYTNISSDSWHSDEEISIDVDKVKGAEIIAFLTEHLGL